MSVLTSLSLLQTAQAQNSNGYATVFIYHRFGDSRYPTTSVKMEDFKKEMLYLKKNNYNVISLKELYKLVKEKKPIPSKTVVITIDDGYKTTMKAYRILKEMNFPFTVFLYMEAVNRYPDFLTEKQIREMEKSGLVDFENHLYSHPNLAKWRLTLSQKEYIKRLEREKELSEKKFKKLFGRKPEFLAFPYGDYDKISVKFFKENGYELLLTQDRGTYAGKGILVPRMAVVGSQSGFRKFVSDLKIEPLPVIKHTPDYGVYSKNRVKPTFYIENPEKYRNCWIYATKNGWVKGIKRGDRVESSVSIPIKSHTTRIGIRCWDTENKQKAEYFFLLLH